MAVVWPTYALSERLLGREISPKINTMQSCKLNISSAIMGPCILFPDMMAEIYGHKMIAWSIRIFTFLGPVKLEHTDLFSSLWDRYSDFFDFFFFFTDASHYRSILVFWLLLFPFFPWNRETCHLLGNFLTEMRTELVTVIRWRDECSHYTKVHA